MKKNGTNKQKSYDSNYDYDDSNNAKLIIVNKGGHSKNGNYY